MSPPQLSRLFSSSQNAWRGTPKWTYLPILNITKGLLPAVLAAPTTSVHRAVVDMVKMRGGSLVVSVDGDMKGIITERDILDKLPFQVGSSRTLKVEELMTSKEHLVTAQPSSTLDQCVKAMKGGHFRHLPIVQEGELKAVLSIKDLSQHLASSLTKTNAIETTTVADIMDANPSPRYIELTENCSVGDAVLRMRESRNGFAIVKMADGYGIFTERDYLMKVCVYDEANPSDIPVTSVMTHGPVIKTVKPEGRIADCLSLMVAGGFRHLPVTSKTGVVGVISMRDILQHFLGSAPTQS